MLHKVLNICTILLTIILWGLQMIPEDNDNVFVSFARNNVYEIALFSCIVVVSMHLIDLFLGRLFVRYQNRKRWIKMFLQHIVDQHLGGDFFPTRISLLRKRAGIIVFFDSIYNNIVRNLINNFKNHTWKRAFKNIAIHIFSDYLTIYTRHCYPKAKPSHTYFRLSDQHNRYNGVADRCFQEGIDISVSTINISDINLTDNFSELAPDDKLKVKKYMKDCHFSKDFYSSLLSMNRVPNNLYAIPIAQNDQTIWGVVIIDNIENSNIDYKSELESFMASYMKIISFSLSSLS